MNKLRNTRPEFMGIGKAYRALIIDNETDIMIISVFGDTLEECKNRVEFVTDYLNAINNPIHVPA